MKKILRSKRAAIGEAITWVVATIIVLVVMTIFIFASNIMAKGKNLGVGGETEIEIGELIEIKTGLAFEQNELNKESIENWIKKEKDYG